MLNVISELSREEIVRLINEKKEMFIYKQFEDNRCMYMSKVAIEINGVRFRIEAYLNDSNVRRVTLVAVGVQSNVLYKNYDTDNIHRKWLKQNYGEPTESFISGVKYVLPNMVISSEHDPRSGSNRIFISYKDVNN